MKNNVNRFIYGADFDSARMGGCQPITDPPTGKRTNRSMTLSAPERSCLQNMNLSEAHKFYPILLTPERQIQKLLEGSDVVFLRCASQCPVNIKRRPYLTQDHLCRLCVVSNL